ncbi:MAG TPA: hypothetical protein VFC86_12170 [Planctomycetota bacterium]|nr:hypothetical protein [Planctomycetota bacterium]
MSNADLHSALQARNRADRKDVVMQLLLGIPVTLFGLFFANLLILPLIYVLDVFGISPGLRLSLAVFNALLITAIVIDVRRRPSESWYVPRYYQSDGSVKGHEFGVSTADPLSIPVLEHYKGGAFSGMPLMTNLSDPHNMAERGRALSSGFANLILGGPRSIGRALAQRRMIADRSKRRTVSAAERFTAWLASRGVVPESEVQAHLEAHPDQAEGLALARELEVVTRRRNPVEFHYTVR